MTDLIDKTPAGAVGGTGMGTSAKEIFENPIPDTEKKEKKYNIYYSHRGSVRMCCPSGKPIHFVGGKFVTDEKEAIKFLDAELASRNKFIYVKEGEEVVSSTDLDPMAVLRRKIIKEEADKIIEVAQKQMDGSRDMGSTGSPERVARKVNIGSTKLLTPKVPVNRDAEVVEHDLKIGAQATVVNKVVAPEVEVTDGAEKKPPLSI